MNVYTVRYATQGMADLIHSCGEVGTNGMRTKERKRIKNELCTQK